MSDTKRRAVAESVFNRNQRRETEINDALKQGAVRHAAVIKNMHRLRALRLARDKVLSPIFEITCRTSRKETKPSKASCCPMARVSGLERSVLIFQ